MRIFEALVCGFVGIRITDSDEVRQLLDTYPLLTAFGAFIFTMAFEMSFNY